MKMEERAGRVKVNELGRLEGGCEKRKQSGCTDGEMFSWGGAGVAGRQGKGWGRGRAGGEGTVGWWGGEAGEVGRRGGDDDSVATRFHGEASGTSLSDDGEKGEI